MADSLEYSTAYGPLGDQLLHDPAGASRTLAILGVAAEPDRDPLTQLADHAVRNWLDININAEGDTVVPYDSVPQHTALKEIGFTETRLPPKETYDAAVVDGGTSVVFDLRLAFFDELRARGLSTNQVVICAGQRLRLPRDGDLELAAGQLAITDEWLRDWVGKECAKQHDDANPWERPFATEHEVAIMALARRYGSRLQHVGTVSSIHTESVTSSIPPVAVQAEIFAVDGITFTVLNGRAVLRELHGQAFPPEEARPTGASCFAEWLEATNPAPEASILLISNQPNAERSLYDLELSARQHGRGDLEIDYAAGPMEEGSSYRRVLAALARTAFSLLELRRFTTSEENKAAS